MLHMVIAMHGGSCPTFVSLILQIAMSTLFKGYFILFYPRISRFPPSMPITASGRACCITIRMTGRQNVLRMSPSSPSTNSMHGGALSPCTLSELVIHIRLVYCLHQCKWKQSKTPMDPLVIRLKPNLTGVRQHGRVMQVPHAKVSTGAGRSIGGLGACNNTSGP